ncbi:threonine/serine ThrE exporter family protein [Pseudemcibacter aquimaris]|uniref:threonine/serine ThrE exporter family protein n=1 Tax=Pseudemcibacter aquimaris TaxID=2857064 RepID=UPI002012EF70|nr:threonine/serine exporter family protein [Pseudemcibacter aquimaris]MCC3861298.1 threonine/serine exporter family protein [Pseudemcibacter aquimaris]WDU58072.1 threonine/serine exporter family protein [Pseudemcibacter aquimaris]
MNELMAMTDQVLTDERTVKYSVARRFIIKLGIIAHGYGPSAARLESYLKQVTEALGYGGHFHSTRSEIIYAFWKDDKMDQIVHMEAVEKGSFNMAKLARVGEVVEAVVGGGMTLDDAYDILMEIDELPNPWGPFAKAVSFLFIGVGFAGLMSGNILDIVIAGTLAILVYGNVHVAHQYGGRVLELLPFSSAYTIGIITAVIKIFMPEINVSVIVLAAIISIIPGFSVSAGIVEIVSNHVVSGSENLISGVIYLLKQFFGAWFGLATIGFLFPGDPVPGAVSESLGLWLFLPLLFIGLGIAYQSLIRDFPWVMLCCLISYLGVIFGNTFEIQYLGTLVGAITATVYGNLWARKFNRPTSIVLVPAITVMVSGSVGFQGLMIAATEESSRGFDQFLQMFIVALVISAGLLIANTIVRPKVTL